MYFVQENGSVILHDTMFDVKVVNRQLYFKPEHKDQFVLITEQKVPLGYNYHDKQRLLTMLNEKIKRDEVLYKQLLDRR